MTTNIYDDLLWRGMIAEKIEGVQELLGSEKVTVYNGFDATGDSLHVGHMVPLLGLARLQRYGHHPIALAGGGTTMIGDPSGKSSERPLLTREQIDENAQSIKQQLAHFLDFESKSNPARLMNNADWLLQLNLIDFLRDIGKHFSVNYMLAKDSVKTRIDREQGLSYTEFSYMLMQSYDFLYLHDHYGCKLQTGGTDQWGNITAGVELVRRVRGVSVGAMAYPLITRADGTKFGKTASGQSVWLKAERTSPYRFYQFFFNTDDRDVIKYLKIFTFLEKSRVDELEAALLAHPEEREAQRVLAREATGILHGESALARAEQATQALFGGEISGLSAAEIADIFADVPSSELPAQRLEGGLGVIDLLAETSLAKSRGEARRFLGEGGLYLNNHRVSEVSQTVSAADLLDGRFLILRKGKKNYHLVKVIG